MTLPPIRSFSASGIRGGDAENSRKRNQMSDGPSDHDILLFGSRTHLPRPMDPPPSPTPSFGHDVETSDDLGPQEGERDTADNPKTSESEVFMCTIPNCGLVLETDDILSAHVLQCEKRIAAQQYPCPEPGCDESFSTAHKLLRHRTVHKADVDGSSAPTDFLCRWKGCGKVLATRTSLKVHERIHIEKADRTKLNCTIPGCGKSFETDDLLSAHVLQCEKRIATQQYPHEVDADGNSAPTDFLCRWKGCDKVLATRTSLKVHEQIHREKADGTNFNCTSALLSPDPTMNDSR